MALAFQSVTTSADLASATACPCAYPASTAAGNILVCFVATKPFNAVINTPGPDWQPLGQIANGTTAASTADVGSMLIAAFVKEANGTETGNLTVNITSGNSSSVAIYRYTKAAGQAFTAAGAFGTDAAAGASWSIAYTSNPGITSGDALIVADAWPTDALRILSAQSLTATGATISAPTNDAGWQQTTGFDMGGALHHTACTAGTASANPNWATTHSVGTNNAGSSALVRLREIAPGTLTHLAMGVHQ